MDAEEASIALSEAYRRLETAKAEMSVWEKRWEVTVYGVWSSLPDRDSFYTSFVNTALIHQSAYD